MFETELNYIKNPIIKEAAKFYVSMLPKYFYDIPASSTGKYHPKYTLGEYGLYKHVKAAVRIAYELMQLEMYNTNYTSDERDLIYLSIILHDGFKSGIEKEKYTRFDHPIIMANFVLENYEKANLSKEYAIIVADAIKTHMGQWTTDFNGNEILEKPQTKIQKFVHQCDYLASRKFLNVEFNTNNEIID